MAALGVPSPRSPDATTVSSGAAAPSTARVYSLGGLMQVGNAAAALAMDAKTSASLSAAQQAQPAISGLAGHVRSLWTQAKEAKQSIEQRMIDAMYARRGEYTPAKLAQIREQRQPPIYMMVASGKMRQIESLLRDVIVGSGDEKPWTLRPTPTPQLPPQAQQALVDQLTAEIEQALATGFQPSVEAAQVRLRQLSDELQPMLIEEARRHTERMERRMEDQLVEGGYMRALSGFIVDLATFPTAFVAGPVVRQRPALQWGPQGEMLVQTALQLEWERVDPFDVYPAPWARSIDEGPLIRRHRLSRQDLNEMIGVSGYSEAAIREVLRRYDDRGFREWTSIDSQRDTVEDKTTLSGVNTGLVDALQCWCSASGQMLLDWGMPSDQVPDPTKEYHIDAWLVDSHVIKAVLNADPLARRGLFATSFQRIPGSVWGNSPYDLMRDCQDMCNGAARALAANLAISSGPQVGIISNRLPAGEDVTEMYPWKIWQFESDPMGTSAAPITFFQPQSNANELMGVYERFSALADEYTGIPRYMAGFETAGAGRTASGMSMMISNASKIIRQVAGNIDADILVPMLEGLYYHNMRYGEDPDLKGDLKVVALGALALVTKEAAQVRTNEFLQATANPVDMQIIGLDGRAELLRHAVKRLDVNPNKVVPPPAVLRQRQAEQLQAMAAQALAGAQPSPGGTPAKPGGENLADGTPTTDHFSPT